MNRRLEGGRLKSSLAATFRREGGRPGGLSRYRRAIGSDQWTIRLDDGCELVTVYAPEQAQPAKGIALVGRAQE